MDPLYFSSGLAWAGPAPLHPGIAKTTGGVAAQRAAWPLDGGLGSSTSAAHFKVRRRMLVLGFVRLRATLTLPAAASAVLATASTVLAVTSAVLAVTPTVLAAAPALAAQDRDASNPDSVALHEEAKEVQARFERFREERIPPELGGFGRGCDEIVGRFCLRFESGEDESEWTVPEEPVEFGMARVQVLRELADIHAQIPRDSWILGQRVFYMGEVGNWQGAENLLTDRCGGGNWWCTSLLGFVRHAQGDWNMAADLFALAVNQIPEGEDFLSLGLLLDPDAYDVYENASDQAAAEERLWLLSDPLYLVDGNDRMTEQYARAVLIRMRREAVNPYGVEWGDDIEELTLRYGAEGAWERRRALPNGTLQDTRSIVGRHHPKSQEFLPPDLALDDPALVAPGDWTLEQRRPWTGYAPPYAPDLNALETQVARFRRGDSLLVAGAFAPEEEDAFTDSRRETMNPRIVDLRAQRDVDRADQQARLNPFGTIPEEPQPFIVEEPQPEGPVQSALFLIDTESGARHEIHGEGPRGAFRLQVPNGRYVVGIEAFSPDAKEAWRDRHGLWQDPIVPGLAAVSDLLILSGGGEIPTSLDEALPTALPAVRIQVGQPFKVAWELYGLQIGESANVRIGVDQGGPGFFRRIGQFLRVLQPDSPVVLSFADAAPDRLGTVFRAVQLNLPDLEPGEYVLTVEIELPGREPMTVDRPIVIVP